MSELTVRDGTLAIHAKLALETRAKKADLETQETKYAQLIAEEAMSMARSFQDKDNYLHIIRISPEGSAPVRTEFRIEKGALKIDDKPKLEKLFGYATDELFERSVQVGSIENPETFIRSLKERHIDPWKVLNVSIKEGCEGIAVNYGIPHTEILKPKPNFLGTLCEIGNKMSVQAKTYIKNYLGATLKARVVLGTRGKGE